MLVEIFVTTVLLLSVLLSIRTKSTKVKHFNGPIRFPIIGSSIQFVAITALNNLANSIEIFRQKYGAICGLYVGSSYFVFVHDPILGKEILNQDDLSRKFPQTSITTHLYGPKNLGISQAHGEVLKEMRRFSNRNLKRFGFGKLSSMNEIIQSELRKYLEEFETKRVHNGGLVYMNDTFYLSTLNILWSLMTGLKFESYDKRLEEIVRAGRAVLKEDPLGSLLLHGFPSIRLLPGLTVFREAKQFWAGIKDYLKDIVDERRRKGEYKINPSNFIDMFLIEIEKGTPMYSDGQCIQTCMDLFVAGLDSTANTLDWIFLYLISYPEVYEKVQLEIDSIIGLERNPTLEDRNMMPYTEATMLEVFRIANVIEHTMRAPLHETTFKGYLIPENSHIIIKLSCFHKSKEIWGDDVEKFYPERFLDDQNNIINSDKIFTFGYGKRVCIGEASSKMTIFLFLTSILQRYKLQASPRHRKPTLKPHVGILVSYPEPFHILADQR